MTTTAHSSPLSIYTRAGSPQRFFFLFLLSFSSYYMDPSLYSIQTHTRQARARPSHTHRCQPKKKKGKKSSAFFFFVSYRSCLFDNLIPATLYLVSHTLSSLPVCVCVSLYLVCVVYKYAERLITCLFLFSSPVPSSISISLCVYWALLVIQPRYYLF
jgi:hypothetical protein